METHTSKERLSKVMARRGVASRRHCEELIFAGKVSVNGKIALLPQTMVGDGDAISIDGTPLPAAAKNENVYYLLNKPRGYLCTNAPERQKKLVIDLFKKDPRRLFTVGRLDKETTGLIIVTNDGFFAQQVIHPSSDIEKEYVAEVDLPLTQLHLSIIRKGMRVEGTFVRPKSVDKLSAKEIRVVVKEGKKREVRQLIQHAGLAVCHLCRTRIGQLRLQNLPEGKWREMTEEEKQQLFSTPCRTRVRRTQSCAKHKG